MTTVQPAETTRPDTVARTGQASQRPQRPQPGRAARERRDQRTAALVEELRCSTVQVEQRRLRDELIMLNIPMARLLARRYRHRGESDDDLEQVALMGLTTAAQRFDPHVTTSFHGYCVPTVLGTDPHPGRCVGSSGWRTSR